MIMINVIGIALILLIVWWFWLYRSKSSGADSLPSVVVVADGVYEPAHFRLPAGEPVTLYFLREDPSPCAEMVVFPDLEISSQLPVDKETPVHLPALKPGNYRFHCQMQMYKGELTVE